MLYKPDKGHTLMRFLGHRNMIERGLEYVCMVGEVKLFPARFI